MERFVKGDVLVVAFPFSDLKTTKKRPVLVLAQADFGDVVVCQITSSPYRATNIVHIRKSSFESGGLPITSFARPDKIFTADQKLILHKVGRLTPATLLLVDVQLKRLFVL